MVKTRHDGKHGEENIRAEDDYGEYPESLRIWFEPQEELEEVKVERKSVKKLVKIMFFFRLLVSLFLLLIGIAALLVPDLRNCLFHVMRQFITEIQVF